MLSSRAGGPTLIIGTRRSLLLGAGASLLAPPAFAAKPTLADDGHFVDPLAVSAFKEAKGEPIVQSLGG